MAEKRFLEKKNKNFAVADELRKQIEEKGFALIDSKESYTIMKK